MPLLRRRSLLDFRHSSASQRQSQSQSQSQNSDHSAHNNEVGSASLGTSADSDSAFLRPVAHTPRTLQRPVSSQDTPSHSRLSHELHPDDIDAASTDDGRPNKRFSLMRFRNFSESHLSTRAKMDAERARVDEDLPPLPRISADVAGPVPTIVKTAPTMDHAESADQHEQQQHEEERKPARPSLFKRASARERKSQLFDGRKSMDETRQKKTLRWRRGKSGLEDLHRLSTMHLKEGNNQHMAPPSYGDETNSALAIPVSQLDPRSSEASDGSNGSSGDGHIYASTTTTTHTVSTHTTFFKLPRRNKNRNSLFPVPIKLPPPDDPQSHGDQGPATPRASTHSTTEPPGTASTEHAVEGPQLKRAQTEASPTKRRSQSALSSPHASLAKASLSFAEPGMNLFRHSSTRSQNSATSSPLQPPMRLGLRDRSSTTSSFGAHSSQDAGTPPPLSASGRNSTSTTGRSSFGGFLNLSRFRQSSEPHSPRHGSPGTGSKSNSFAMSREALVIPEREEGDTPGKYLERLESAVARSVIAGILSKSSDPFAQAVLRSYTRRFPFFTEPIDMSLRKFLLEAELPKETQQVDRVIQAFADRYHECNPGIYVESGAAYVIAFSIMMLHTDAFNKNNKRKMQKQDYLKNTSGQGISDDVLACIYDNIVYTPFIHIDEDVDFNGEKILPFKSKKHHHAKLRSAIPGADATRKPSGSIDPYILIMENKLDALRPNIKDSIMMDDPYDYRGRDGELDPGYLQRAFTHTGTIQIISARSRPAAYESHLMNGQPNPTETQQQGIVDLKITKVGLLWRKSSKKKKTRSPWQEWGAILTGSQLYLFKNSHWAKGLMQQFHNAQRSMQPRTPVTFKPPLQDFKPDALIKTDNAIALVDSTYTRHKNAFTFVGTSGKVVVFLADNENELNDWLGLINYAAAFRAAGVRIRGMVGGSEEDTRSKDVTRLDSTKSATSIHSQIGEAAAKHRTMEPSLQRQVLAARRQIMVAKIGELEKAIVDANRQLENMLRNARHLLVLAPIAPKTREDVMHAAAKADAMIKWARRDIWRMKAHRDSLAMDVRIDGLSASDIEKLTLNAPAEPESAKKHKPTMLTRLSSSRTPNMKSPPQSPLTLQRPSTRGSVDRPAGIDVFSTPPESTTSPVRDDGWRLPPLSINAPTEQDSHRPSVTSTLLSASPPGSRISLSHSASTSSMLQVQRTASTSASETTTGRSKTTPAGSINERELQLLARSTMAPEAESENARGPSFDGTMAGTSPESRHKGVRRSLQKTLRDHHGHSHSHRHRRNKESDSTVRSGGFDDRETEEATPGLARDKPRFILHGKQASVVQFGGDWERMKLRREQYSAQNGDTPYQAQLDAAVERRRSEQHELLRAGMASPVVQDFARDTGDDDTDNMSVLSEGSRSFREDAQAAAAYTTRRSPAESPGHMSSSEDVSDAISGVFDLTSWDPDAGRRTTVIGPSPTKTAQSLPFERHRRYSSLQKSPDGNIEHVEEDPGENSSYYNNTVYSTPPQSSTDRNNRRTVIGPSTSPMTVMRSPSTAASNSSSSRANTAFGHHGSVRKIASAEASTASTSLGRRLFSSTGSASAGATHDSHDEGEHSDGEDEHGFVATISDDELRRMSSSLSAPASPQRMRVM